MPQEQILARQQSSLELIRAVNTRSVRQFGRDVYGFASVFGAPAAYRVVVFESEPQWINARMAACAGGIGAMFGQAFTYCFRRGALFLFERRDIGRWRRGRRAEQRLENPLASQDGAGAMRIGRCDQDGRHAEQPAAMTSLGQFNALWLPASIGARGCNVQTIEPLQFAGGHCEFRINQVQQ